MQVIIIEPLLKDQSGHQFSYTLSLEAELKRRGIPVVVLGNKSADRACKDIKNFYPSLTGITTEFFKNSPALKKLIRLIKLIRLLRDEFDDLLISDLHIEKQEENILFIHSLYIFELLSFGLFLKRRARLFSGSNNKIFLGFNFGYKRESIISTVLLAFLYKIVYQPFTKGLASQIIYFSDGKTLAEDYERLLKQKVFFLPAPVNNQFLESQFNPSQKSPGFIPRDECTLSSARKQASGLKGPRGSTNSIRTKVNERVVISYLGGARYNKGFDIFVEVLKVLLDQSDIAEKILLHIQVDIHEQQSEAHKKIILESASVLEGLSASFKNIRLFYGPLSIEEYFRLLADTDLIVLPYREILLRSTHSNIFREAVVSGKIPVVTSNTTSAEELLKYNLENLVFNIEDIARCVDIIKNVVNNIDDYKLKIKNMQSEWLSFYSAKTLVDRLINLLSVDHPG